MSNFIITADSNSDLPKEFIQKNNMTIIPQYYGFGDEVYGDEKNLTPTEFYAKMRNGEMPTSMANNPVVIRERFLKLLEQGYDILHVAFSSSLSGSYQNVFVAANELKEEFPDRKIYIIDSLNVSLAESILIFHAYEMQDNGASIEEIRDWIEDNKQRLHVYFTVNDLHHLQKGGRVSKTKAVLGSMINVKPILCVDREGKLVSAGTVRGRKHSLNTLVLNMKENMPSDYDRSEYVGILHADCLEEANYVKEYMEKEYGFTNIIINDVSPSIGTHAGPGTIGIIYLGFKK